MHAYTELITGRKPMAHPKYEIFKDEKYLKYIRQLPCLVCSRPSESHHVWHSGGKKLSNDYLAVPLCNSHHTMGGDSYHRLGHDTFEKRHNLDLKDEIINLLCDYLGDKKDGFKYH